MLTPVDPKFMVRAIELSRQGYPAPNPHVGCVIEKDGIIVGEGYHDHAGGPHAEVMALTHARELSRGATAYTTQEPCNNHGRTGPCSEALIAAGVSRVISAVKDPNPNMAGGNDRLRNVGIEVIEGLLSDEAESANVKWLTAVRRQRPYIVGKAGISLDGRVALESGESKWITGEESRRQAHILRAECGAVLVGTKTVEKDDPELTVRHIEVVNQPLRIVLDRDHRLGAYKVFNSDAPFLRVTAKQGSEHDLVVQQDEGKFDLHDLTHKLYEKGVTSLLVEGGAVTLSQFLAAGLIDRLELFIAPKVLGNGPSWAQAQLGSLSDVPNWNLSTPRLLGQDLWITAFPATSK